MKQQKPVEEKYLDEVHLEALREIDTHVYIDVLCIIIYVLSYYVYEIGRVRFYVHDHPIACDFIIIVIL